MAKMAEENYKNLSDDELVILAREGDSFAFDTLLQKYTYIIKIKARKYYAPGVDNADLVQEGNIGLLNSIKDYKLEHPTPFKSFCELCIERQIITAIKTATRQKHLPLNKYTSFDKPVFDEGSEKTLYDVLEFKKVYSPEEIILDQQNVLEILTKIKERFSPFELKVLDKQLMKISYLEMAIELDKHIKSVDNAMQRIRAKLYKIVEEMHNNDGM